MKTKTKTIALMEIAIVLCSVFLVALPAIAADQTTQEANANTITTASEDDYVLGVYGNANEDDTIDMRDLTYVKLIFFGKKPETELADAKYDGKINPLDFIQIKLIIVGKEKELTIVDDVGRIVTVKKPIKRVVVLSGDSARALRSLKATDKVIGVSSFFAKHHPLFFPELSKLPSVGSGFKPDIEKVLELEPDLVLTYAKYPSPEEFDDKLPENIKVLHLYLYGVCGTEPLIENLKKLGYIFEKKKEAEAIIDFYEEFYSKINKRVEKLSENEKPRVHIEYGYLTKDYHAIGKDTGPDNACTMAGGINIADFTRYKTVDPEWVAIQNPDIIISVVSRTGYEYDDPSETDMEAIRERIMNRPELAKVRAVKDGKVYSIAHKMTYGQNFIGSIYLAKWFHPELFEDLDPEAVHKEYLEKFQGMPYRGVYVYPPLAS